MTITPSNHNYSYNKQYPQSGSTQEIEKGKVAYFSRLLSLSNPLSHFTLSTTPHKHKHSQKTHTPKLPTIFGLQRQ